MSASRKLIEKFVKSKVYADDGRKMRKDVMSKTLIRLLKRFVMNAYAVEISVIEDSSTPKDISMFIKNVRQLTRSLFQDHMPVILANGLEMEQLESFVGFFISPQKCR